MIATGASPLRCQRGRYDGEVVRVKQSAFPFVAFGMVLLFGLIAGAPDGGSLTDLHLQRERLVREGVPVQARVTYKGHGGDSEWVTYAFSVGGKRFESTAWPTPRELIELQVGSPLTIRYLPSDPSVSYYEPARWLAGQAGVKRTGNVIAGIGAAGLVLSAAVAAARSRGMFGDSSWLARIVTAPRVIGLLFFAAGMGFQVMMLWQSLLGDGFIFQSNGGPSHRAGWLEIAGLSAFMAIFWGIGLALMIFGGARRRR